MRHTRILAALGALALSACAVQCDPVNPPQPGPVGGASSGGQVSTGGSAGAAQGGVGGLAGAPAMTPCDLAGAQLVRLKCIYLTELQSWVGQCAKAATIPGATFDAECVTRATTKAAVRACQSVPCAEIRL